MHVIFGGAFNGKRTYVEQMVQGRKVQWLNSEVDAYVLLPNVEVVVVSGVEHLLESQSDELLEKMEEWDKQVEVVVIATEIGRGIVPIDPNQRKLRDDVGRFYQQLFTKASCVTRIWYGISQTIKGDDLIENLH